MPTICSDAFGLRATPSRGLITTLTWSPMNCYLGHVQIHRQAAADVVPMHPGWVTFRSWRGNPPYLPRMVMGRVLGVTLAASIATATAACSGPHVQEIIRGSILTSQLTVGLQLVMGIGMGILFHAVQKGPGHPALAILMLVINPYWWMNPLAGDCGFMMASGSIGVTALSGCLLVWQIYLWRRRR